MLEHGPCVSHHPRPYAITRTADRPQFQLSVKPVAYASVKALSSFQIVCMHLQSHILKLYIL